MKNLIVIATVFLMQASFALAQIENSTNSKQHQTVMEKAITDGCGYFRNLTQVSQSEIPVQIDQVTRDIRYTTVLSGEQRTDQFMDSYKIVVQSEYIDVYDHVANDWGSYVVTSVRCEQE